MSRVLGSDEKIWLEIGTLRGKNRQAAIAYLGDSAPYLLRMFRSGDTLICDASTERIRSGSTSKLALRELYDRGVNLYSLPNLHAKVLCIGNTAVVGSMNASTSSVKQFEIAAFLTDAKDVSSSRAFIKDMLNRSTEIDDEFLERIGKIPVRKRTGKKSFPKQPGVKQSIVISPVESLEHPRFVQTATATRLRTLRSQAGFRIKASCGNPNESRYFRLDDIVLWVYNSEGSNPKIQIGRVVDMEKVRSRWIYYDLTPVRATNVRVSDLRSLLAVLGYQGSVADIGSEERRIALPELRLHITELFGDSYPGAA
jgi:hypothetical protein